MKIDRHEKTKSRDDSICNVDGFEINTVHDGCLIDPSAPLSIIRFRAATLHSDFTEGVKSPGIYGTLLAPVELLDPLCIENGINVSDVRFAAQFSCTQRSIDMLVSSGKAIRLSSNLSLYIPHD